MPRGRMGKREMIIPMSAASLSRPVAPPQEQVISRGDDETVRAVQEEHLKTDAKRTFSGVDLSAVRREAQAIIDLRAQLEARAEKPETIELDTLAAQVAPLLKEKHPMVFRILVFKVAVSEAQATMGYLFDMMEKANNGEVTQTGMREKVFEQDFAKRYIKARP
jgi:hypothetical protein